MSHNLVNNNRKSRKTPTTHSSSLRPALRLQHCASNTSTGNRIPKIVLSPILLDQTLTAIEDSRDESEISAPIDTFFPRCSNHRSHLLAQGSWRYFLSLDDGDGRRHVGHETEEDSHYETHGTTTGDTQDRSSGTEFLYPAEIRGYWLCRGSIYPRYWVR